MSTEQSATDRTPLNSADWMAALPDESYVAVRSLKPGKPIVSLYRLSSGIWQRDGNGAVATAYQLAEWDEQHHPVVMVAAGEDMQAMIARLAEMDADRRETWAEADRMRADRDSAREALVRCAAQRDVARADVERLRPVAEAARRFAVGVVRGSWSEQEAAAFVAAASKTEEPTDV